MSGELMIRMDYTEEEARRVVIAVNDQLVLLTRHLTRVEEKGSRYARETQHKVLVDFEIIALKSQIQLLESMLKGKVIQPS